MNRQPPLLLVYNVENLKKLHVSSIFLAFSKKNVDAAAVSGTFYSELPGKETCESRSRCFIQRGRPSGIARLERGRWNGAELLPRFSKQEKEKIR
ncbi:hypothetical protein, partial [Paenibacillus dendritiformis]|uniref:hypothetical protein n=1 Tax=Paenibacillus dendritiformis TaxID=130049 RepID=UPI001C262C0B